MTVYRVLLHRIARRCPTHDRAAPLIIRQLEDDLGMEPSTGRLTFAQAYSNPRLIDCRRKWCHTRRRDQ